MSVVANMPVAKAPKIPLTPWHANTSNESSSLVLVARQFATRLETTPAAKPIIIAGKAPTYPEAGVIATRPQTAPTATPTADGFPFAIQSTTIQLTAAS